jgi:hypothetical protein
MAKQYLPGGAVLLAPDRFTKQVQLEIASSISTHAGLADPHTGYRLESADHSHVSTGLQGGQLDHGTALTGLTDDDHTQYFLEAGLVSTYVPVWTGTTTNPVIGNGTIEGFYQTVGKQVRGFFKIEMGGTTTFGSGLYRVSVPVTPNSEYIDFAVVGGLTIHNPGVFRNTWFLSYDTGVTATGLFGTAFANEAWSPTAPNTIDTDSEVIGTFAYLIN